LLTRKRCVLPMCGSLADFLCIVSRYVPETRRVSLPRQHRWVLVRFSRISSTQTSKLKGFRRRRVWVILSSAMWAGFALASRLRPSPLWWPSSPCTTRNTTKVGSAVEFEGRGRSLCENQRKEEVILLLLLHECHVREIRIVWSQSNSLFEVISL